jgi:hypothetical protein
MFQHSKDETISHLVRELFVISVHYMETLKDLTNICMKPPVLVHVLRQGQDLFSENIPLREVIIYLKNKTKQKQLLPGVGVSLTP